MDNLIDLGDLLSTDDNLLNTDDDLLNTDDGDLLFESDDYSLDNEWNEPTWDEAALPASDEPAWDEPTWDEATLPASDEPAWDESDEPASDEEEWDEADEPASDELWDEPAWDESNSSAFDDDEDMQNFDPAASDLVNISGEPSIDMEHWHEQSYDDTCAVVAQEFILDELTGQDFSEDDLRQEAIDNGWYTPGGGTAMYDVGELLEAHGIDVERGNGFTVDDLNSQLEQGHKVIVGLDADEIWSSEPENELVGDYPGMPGQGANHAVQVIGIDHSDPNNPMVILNDPGHPDGQGMMVPLEQFEDAWADSDHFMVHTTGLSTAGVVGQSASVNQLDNPMLGGYYNPDGTYHYSSDDTDRDPETGAIIRRW